MSRQRLWTGPSLDEAHASRIERIEAERVVKAPILGQRDRHLLGALRHELGTIRRCHVESADDYDHAITVNEFRDGKAAMKPSGWVERPDYRVDILRRRNLVTVRAGSRVLARTTAPLLVDEQDHGLVFYVPEADVNFELLTPTDDSSRCPFKGDASYWRLVDGDAPVAWAYREPYPEVARILGHLGFYQDRVTVELGVATPAVVGYQR